MVFKNCFVLAIALINFNKLYELSETGEFDGGFQPVKSSVISAIEMAEVAHKSDGKVAGVSTGLSDIDTIIFGLHQSDLVI